MKRCRGSATNRVVRVALTVAVRRTSRISAISPKHWPSPLPALEHAVLEHFHLPVLDHVEAVPAVALGSHLLARVGLDLD